MKIIFLVLLLTIGVSLNFVATAGSCEANGTNIYYGNGMFSDEVDARESLRSLKELNSESIEASQQNIKYDIALNNNGPLRALALTALKQKLNNNFTTFWRVVSGLDNTPEWYIDAMKRVFQNTVPFEESNSKEMMNHYLDDIHHSRRILLVSHSQGNLYAIESFRKVRRETFPKSSESRDFYDLGLGNIAVATPAFQDFGFPIVTFADDLVMKAVRETFGAPLPTLPSIGIGIPPEGDLSGHSFLKAYMYREESRSLIQSDLAETAKKLKYPNPGITAIKVDMKSKLNAGFELKVTDPSNQKCPVPANRLRSRLT